MFFTIIVVSIFYVIVYFNSLLFVVIYSTIYGATVKDNYPLVCFPATFQAIVSSLESRYYATGSSVLLLAVATCADSLRSN